MWSSGTWRTTPRRTMASPCKSSTRRTPATLTADGALLDECLERRKGDTPALMQVAARRLRRIIGAESGRNWRTAPEAMKSSEERTWEGDCTSLRRTAT